MEWARIKKICQAFFSGTPCTVVVGIIKEGEKEGQNGTLYHRIPFLGSLLFFLFFFVCLFSRLGAAAKLYYFAKSRRVSNKIIIKKFVVSFSARYLHGFFLCSILYLCGG